MNENRNLVLAIALSMIILVGFQFFIEGPKARRQQEELARQQAAQKIEQPLSAMSTAPTPAAGASATGAMLPSVPGGEPGVTPAGQRSREQVVGDQISGSGRIKIATPRLSGSLALEGGRIDDLVLVDYHETPDPNSARIVLLSPSGTPHPYYAEFGWVPGDRTIPVPDAASRWKVAGGGTEVTPKTPITLTWDNGQGLAFEKVVAVDDDYMFTITQRVRNTTDKPVTLHPYALVSRHGTPQTAGYSVLHEGPLGVFESTLKEYKYSDMKDKPLVEWRTVGGWIGVTDKYWLTALVPDQKRPVNARFLYNQRGAEDRYQIDFLGESATVAAGASLEATDRLFAGAKLVRLLDGYADQYGITKFDLAIDFGWFYFLTKPFFYGLDYIHHLVGNFGIAILLFTIIVKGVFFPLADKSYRSMSKMKVLQPEMTKIRERCAGDSARMNQEMMEMYRREKVNPMGGCLPILIQIPVFFALYKVLFVTIEMRHAPFFGWIQDLSAPDPTSVFNLFGLIPWNPPQMLMLGVWPLIMGVTMWLQQQLNPPPPDPVQAKVFSFLPIVFTFMLANFPAGLVIYWAWNNFLSMIQQWMIMRQVQAGKT
ncbi:Membrane protein insertase YidC [uncultured Gammaproteobacteria bacterium]